MIDFDTAAYNYVTILLKPGQDLNGSVEKMKRIAKENNLPVKVLSWKKASGQVAQISDILQMIITVFVILLFFVAIIIIMNTLSMNALERTEEFGMMRAVGARKSFITKMFLAETFSLSFIFGGIGILVGVIVTWIIRPIRIGSGEMKSSSCSSAARSSSRPWVLPGSSPASSVWPSSRCWRWSIPSSWRGRSRRWTRSTAIKT